MSENGKKRITLVLEKPNPLFEKWLTEWKEDAKIRGSQMEKTFNYALLNLRKFKVPLTSGQECKILKGFGDKLCKMLDEKLTEYNKTRGNGSQKIATPCTHVEMPNVKSPNSYCEEYIPQNKSGGYAILTTLYTQRPKSLSKDEIIHTGKHLSNSSFLKPDPGSYYTAWSSMKTLQEKGFVTKHGRPIKYSLTDKGLSLAKKISVDNISEKQVPMVEIASTENFKRKCQDNTSNSYSKVSHTLTTNKENEVIDITADFDSDEDNIHEHLNEVVLDKDIYLGNKISLPSLETLQRIIPHVNNDSVSLKSTNLQTFTFNSSSKSQKTNLNENAKPIKKCVTVDTLLTRNFIEKSSLNSNIRKCSSSSSITSTQYSIQHEQYVFEPNSFDVILYVDIRETAG